MRYQSGEREEMLREPEKGTKSRVSFSPLKSNVRETEC
jgi:hypothetical protein